MKSLSVFHVQPEVAEASSSRKVAAMKLNASVQRSSNISISVTSSSGRGQATTAQPSTRPKLPHLCLED